jgi:hypothetical protein
MGGIHRPEDELDPRFDGEWGFEWVGHDTQDEKQLEGGYGFITSRRVILEGSLLHECSHQCFGLHDVYWSNIEASSPEKDDGKCKLKDETGFYITRGDMFPCSGLMGGDDNRPDPNYTSGTGLYEASSVGGLNANVRFRNGFYGEWQYDLPKQCCVRLTAMDGTPLTGAKVALYQQTGAGITNNTQVAKDLTVGADGVLVLPAQDSGEPADTSTATGHTLLKKNPWGRIDVVGQNITLMLQVDQGGQRDYQFVRVHPFNRAYWNGHHDTFTVPITCRLSSSAKLDLTHNVAVEAKVRTSLKAEENTGNIVDGKVDTAWDPGNSQPGDFIEIELPRACNVGLIQLVQDGGGGAFFQRFRITTSPKPSSAAGAGAGPAAGEFFAEQGPLSFSYAMGLQKDVNSKRQTERWVSYGAAPRPTKVIRIEAIDGGGNHLNEVRVFAEK